MNNNCAQKGIVNMGLCTRQVLARREKILAVYMQSCMDINLSC